MYKIPLYRYLMRLLQDEERAADLLQDTFLRAFTALATTSPPPDPSPWLYRIATNLAYDQMRKRRQWRWFSLQGNEPAPPFEGNIALAQSIQDCLARLRPKEAEALLLYEYVGLNCMEIAVITGEKAATVRVRIHRARTRFRKLYKKELL